MNRMLGIYGLIVVIGWERANLLALLYVIFSCVFVTFSCGILRQVGYLKLIVSIPDLCILPDFYVLTTRLIIYMYLLQHKRFAKKHVMRLPQ